MTNISEILGKDVHLQIFHSHGSKHQDATCNSCTVGHFKVELKTFLPCPMPGVVDRYILLCGMKTGYYNSKDPYHIVANFGSLIHPDYMTGKDDTSQNSRTPVKCRQRATHRPDCRHLRAGNTRASTRMACMHRGAKKGRGYIHELLVEHS